VGRSPALRPLWARYLGGWDQKTSARPATSGERGRAQALVCKDRECLIRW
jgi:hypothetical protein